MKPCIAVKDIPEVPKRTGVDVDKAGKRQVAAATAIDLMQQDLYIERAAAIIASCAQ